MKMAMQNQMVLDCSFTDPSALGLVKAEDMETSWTFAALGLTLAIGVTAGFANAGYGSASGSSTL